MIKYCFKCLILALLGLSFSQAEPYMAVRTGLKCAVCHINVSGGGKRTDFGVVYSHYKLYLKSIRPSDKPVYFGGRINQTVSVGANVRIDRVTNLKTTPTAPDTVQSAGKAAWETKNTLDTKSDMLFTEGDLYFQLDVVQDLLTFYVDHDLKGNGAPREFWALMYLPKRFYIKGGQMLLPYGLRILDDDAFIRDRTGYTYNKRGLGFEAGWEPGPFSLIFNVTDNDLSAVATLVYRKWRIGAQFGRPTRGHGGSLTGDNYTRGVFAGVNFGRFTMISEIDFITLPEKIYQNKQVDQMAFYFENNFHVIRGLNFKTTYELFDMNSDLLGRSYGSPLNKDGHERITIGPELFITPFAQLGAFFRINNFIPQNAKGNQNQLFLRAHGFF